MDQRGDTGTLRFPDDSEIDGFWGQDRIHAPRPMSPLAFDLITDTLALGFTRAHAEYGAPIDMFTRSVNNYLYSSMRPVTDPVEVARRAELYTDLPRRLDEVGDLWENEWKPALIRSVRAGRVRDYRGLTNAELAAELERQRDHMIDQWTVHGRINFGVVAGARFVDFYQSTFEPDDPSEGYQLLQGFVTQTVLATQEMWRLSRRIRASGPLRALFSRPTAEIAATLATAVGNGPDAADFALRFQAYLDEYGWRSDAVYDVADASWREDPSIPIDALRGYAALDDSQDPEAAFARTVQRREELLTRARARLADDPERLATFERYYEAGRHNLPLTEDHAFWIDQSGVVNVRRFLLQVGERLVADGCLAAPDDVFFLRHHDVTAALLEGGDRRDLAARRRASMAAAAVLEAPPTLGVATRPPDGTPMDPLLEAILVRLAGRRPPQPMAEAQTVLTGHGASAGVATGTARVVRSLAEAAKLDEGDILVCEMTLPPWVPLFALAGAVVADTGGQMSHCAIVAREFGIPAVVGTQVGTRVITDGTTITVDGSRGEVHLEPPQTSRH
ncbi:MAG: PEP-utilizing enzyme [Acidimicrobiia bacterium]|nr:PEP-utilizing enzyme [Acidimicrobiia bacterium]MDH4365669.1 PEP-utilizing enzyme [Acidimicrobiia bacterium]MDH5291359.1 PEP-utilizing enzyme [Acidimicrobiia bacterium]